MANQHITSIETTLSDFFTNAEHGQRAVRTDGQNEWVHKDDEDSRVIIEAIQGYTTNGSSYAAYGENVFGETTFYDDILVDEYLQRNGGTDDYIRFQDDVITVALQSLIACQFEDDRVYFPLDVRIGDDGIPSDEFEVRKDQNAPTSIIVRNLTSGTLSYANVSCFTDSSAISMVAYDSAYITDSDLADKGTIQSSSGTEALALISERNDSDIEFYIGGKDSTDKLMKLTASGSLGLGVNLTPTNGFILEADGDTKINNVITNRDTIAGLGGSVDDENSFELGPGYLNINSDTTEATRILQIGKNGSLAFGMSATASSLDFIGSDANPDLRIDYYGNLLVGTTLSPTVNSGSVVVLGDNTNDPTMNGFTSGLYGKIVSGTNEVFAINSDDSAAQLSSHDSEGNWISNTYITRNKKRIWKKFQMEKMMNCLINIFEKNGIDTTGFYEEIEEDIS